MLPLAKTYSINYLFNTIREYFGSSQEAVHLEPREGDIRNSLADISSAKKLIGI